MGHEMVMPKIMLSQADHFFSEQGVRFTGYSPVQQYHSNSTSIPPGTSSSSLSTSIPLSSSRSSSLMRRNGDFSWAEKFDCWLE
jgi:hypothetical protein